MSSKNYSDMASTEKLTEKLLSLESRLEALGYIPTQKEDRSLYANVKYYYTNYPGNPIVQRLMAKFPWGASKRRNTLTKEENIAYIKDSLQSLGYVPGPTEDKALYCKVKYFYANYSDIPAIAELMEKYPLRKQKSPSMFLGMSFDEKVDLLEAALEKYQRIPPIFLNNRFTSNVVRFYSRYPDHPRIKCLMMRFPTYEIYEQLMRDMGTLENYFNRCVEISGKLPGDKSIPMSNLASIIRHALSSHRSVSIVPEFELVKSLIERGYRSERLYGFYERIFSTDESEKS